MRVLVIGAGISGIAMGVRLKRAGIDDFRILDETDGLGGTWRINAYPGAAVDIASLIFQFGFRTHPWQRTHARRHEVLDYLEQVAEEADLERHFVFGTRVTEARWDEDRHRWSVTTAAGEIYRAEVLVSAVGLLSNPNLAAWPGLDTFGGAVMHTQQWRHDVDLADARVAVVGVGSSSAQVVPAIAPVARSVNVFQREPGWVLPKGERTYDAGELRRTSRAWHRRLDRSVQIIRKEWRNLSGRPSYVAGSRRNRAMDQMARDYIGATFADRPDLREAVTPTYPFEGKRVVFSDDFYPALKRDNVRLVPRPVASATPTGLVDVDGEHHEVDVIVTATGFTAAELLSSYEVFGRRGRRLRDTWADGAFAHVGMTVPATRTSTCSSVPTPTVRAPSASIGSPSNRRRGSSLTCAGCSDAVSARSTPTSWPVRHTTPGCSVACGARPGPDRATTSSTPRGGSSRSSTGASRCNGCYSSSAGRSAPTGCAAGRAHERLARAPRP
ncbi:flavin-containing monooxygenase [Rhodococcus koreensis]|uniref:flavin-containing monooxygenase n=1 Tax=Rhodococcus koreensis TaxID=99653 RepID=UPI00366CD929